MGWQLRQLSAAAQLEVQRRYPRLLPGLLRTGLSPEDALALAHNATLLSLALKWDGEALSPRAVLETLSLGQIAGLCEQYLARLPGWERLEAGEAAETEEAAETAEISEISETAEIWEASERTEAEAAEKEVKAQNKPLTRKENSGNAARPYRGSMRQSN